MTIDGFTILTFQTTNGFRILSAFCAIYNTGRVYLGSYSGGVAIIEPSGQTTVYNKNILPSLNSAGEIFPVSGLALDANNNLWVSNAGTP